MSRTPGTMRADGCRRLAWWLVWAYPPRFRRELGLSLVDTLDDRMRARRAAGAPVLAVWFTAIVDTGWNAPVAWARAIRDALERGSVGLQAAPKRTAMDKLRQDLRFALRLWARKPAVVLVAVLTLALGIGANTAMFSIVNAVLLRPLPYADADRLAAIWAKTPTTPRSLLSYDEYVALREQSSTFDDVGLWLGQSVNLTGVAEPQRILGNFVSGSFFDVLHLKAERGRLFDESDTTPGAAKPVVVLSHLFWQRQFNGDPAIVGTAVTLNGVSLTVTGILAPPYDPASPPVDAWVLNYDAFIPVGLFPTPAGVSRAALNATPAMIGIARLKKDTAVATANATLDVISQRISATSTPVQKGRTVFAIPAHEDLVGEARTPLMLLLASVGCVLLIACLNISNLLLARAVDRQREIALRAALGASRGAVTRQLAIEASLLAVVSAAFGLAIGRGALRALVLLRPSGVTLPADIPLDARVLLFTLGTAAVCAALCGLAPALRALRSDLVAGLQGRRTTGTSRVRDAFVVAEIALSVVLIALSGLMVQSLFALQRVDVGFDTRSVFTLQFRLPAAKYKTPQEIARFFEQAIAAVRAVPGVESAALVRRVPLSGNWGDTPFVPEGRQVTKGAEPRAGQNIATPDYFRTMRIPLSRGRDFTDRDDMQAPPVTVVNETLARTIWPGEDPIGKRITVPDYKAPMTVIGVVGGVKHRTPTEPAQPQLYLAHYQSPLIFSSLVARTAVAPLSLTSEIRRAIWSVDKDQPMWSIIALDALVDTTRGSARFLASLLGIFAGVALLLACVGIYGVMSYAVTERTHEIGIRMALGASAVRVRREIVGRGLRMTALALAIGVPAAIALARLARGVLFGVTPGDPATFAGAAALLAIVSVAACYVPARRASRVDPVVALAEE
jgi:predicted permease